MRSEDAKAPAKEGECQPGNELVVEQVDHLGRSAGATIALKDELHRRDVMLGY